MNAKARRFFKKYDRNAALRAENLCALESITTQVVKEPNGHPCNSRGPLHAPDNLDAECGQVVIAAEIDPSHTDRRFERMSGRV